MSTEIAPQEVTEYINIFKSLDVSQAITALLIFVIGVLIVKLLLKSFNKLLLKSKAIPPTLHGVLKTILRIVLYLIVCMTVANYIGIPITSFLTLLSVISLAVTLAVQGMLNNLVGSFIILVSKPAGLRFTPTEVSLRYDYSTSEGVTRVSYVRTSMRFKCDWKKKLLRTDFTAISELVTTDRKPGDVDMIPRKESFSNRDALSDKAAIDFDPEFWKDYNIIEPTESLDRAIGRIKRQTDRK